MPFLGLVYGIIKKNYSHYIIKDLGKYNPDFVIEHFMIFIIDLMFII